MTAATVPSYPRKNGQSSAALIEQPYSRGLQIASRFEVGTGIMTISFFTSSEEQLAQITARLKAAGLFNHYEEQAHGENIMVLVQTRTFDERETVRTIVREAGITEYIYQDESAA